MGLEYPDEKREEEERPLLQHGLSSLLLLIFTCLHCPVFITVSVEQLFKYLGSLSCHTPPPGSLHPPVPLQLILCFVTLREEGGGVSDFVCFFFFFSLAVGLDIFNFGRTKR